MTLPVAQTIKLKDFSIIIYPESITNKFPGMSNEIVIKNNKSEKWFTLDINDLWKDYKVDD